jgi:zinc D-Ala-D-Ala carboxypeptidase
MPRERTSPTSPLPAGNLTPHFTLHEFTASDTAAMRGIDNTPTPAALAQLEQTAELMERVRATCGSNPVLISSGYRCPALNSAVGGAAQSAHLYGCAADFTVPAFGSVLDVCHAIEPHLHEWGVDQLIYENASWIHIGRAIPPSETPRCQVLTINSAGTFNGIVA